MDDANRARGGHCLWGYKLGYVPSDSRYETTSVGILGGFQFLVGIFFITVQVH